MGKRRRGGEGRYVQVGNVVQKSTSFKGVIVHKKKLEKEMI